MMLCGKKSASNRIRFVREKTDPAPDVNYNHPYACAIKFALSDNIMTAENGYFYPDRAVTSKELEAAVFAAFDKTVQVEDKPLTHADAVFAFEKAL